MAEVERRATLYGLAAVQWPEPWPSDYLMAMRAATYAFEVGKGVQFALCAFRRAFQTGADLSIAEQVLAVGADVDIDPSALEHASNDPLVKGALRDATDAAHAEGVFGVPTVLVEGEIFWGDDRLQEAEGRLLGAPRSSAPDRSQGVDQ